MSLGCVYENGLCSRLSEKAKLKRLSERDLGLTMSVSSSYIPGIDLNSVLFNKEGYYANSTNGVLDALDAGLRRIYLDVYWDSYYSKWHLCPYRPPTVLQQSILPNNQTTTIGTTLTASSTGNIATLTMYSAPVASTDVDEDGIAANQEWRSDAAIKAANTQAFINMTNQKNSSSYPNTTSTTNSTSSVPCDYVLDLKLFVEKLSSYLELSDTNIAAGLVYLHLRPKIWDSPPQGVIPAPYTFGQANINTTFEPIAKRILTPVKNNRNGRKPAASSSSSSDNPSSDTGDSDTDDNSDGIEWPTLKSLLYSDTDRMLLSYTPRPSSDFPDLSQLDDLAFALVPTIEHPEQHSIEELANLNFTDAFVNDENQWNQTTVSGVSPVLSESSFGIYSDEMLTLLNEYGNWAWSTGQPILYTDEQREAELKLVGNRKNTELAACAVFTDTGLAVANCYAHFPTLCKNKSNDLDWKLADDNHTYFGASCPPGYKFGVPQSPLQARYIRENIVKNDEGSWYAWVDFNSLFLPNCWMSGGTDAVCPYNVVENNRNGIGYIAVAGAVAGVIGLVTLLFELDRRRSPLLRNYKKRNRNQANEFEGIPS